MIKIQAWWLFLIQGSGKAYHFVKKYQALIGITAAAIIAFGSLLTPLYLYFSWFPHERSGKTEAWAHFGDYFGGVVGTLFAVFGFVFLYFSFVLQRYSSYRDAFENRLFKMMEFHFRLIENLRDPSKPESEKGPLALDKLFRAAEKFVQKTVRLVRSHEPPPYSTDEEAHEVFKKIQQYAINTVQQDFAELNDKHFAHLGHFFRHLYWIFRSIQDSQLKERDKISLAKILRAQLSPAEVVLVGLNGMTERGEKFRPFIEQFALLHPRQDDSAFYEIFELFYHMRALGDEHP